MKETVQCVMLLVSMFIIAWLLMPYLEPAPPNVKLAAVMAAASIFVAAVSFFYTRLYCRIRYKEDASLKKE